MSDATTLPAPVTGQQIVGTAIAAPASAMTAIVQGAPATLRSPGQQVLAALTVEQLETALAPALQVNPPRPPTAARIFAYQNFR